MGSSHVEAAPRLSGADDCVRPSLPPNEYALACGRPWRYRTMLMMLPGFADLVMIVITPAVMPSLAATILVPMPPVPTDEPALETVTHGLEL